MKSDYPEPERNQENSKKNNFSFLKNLFTRKKSSSLSDTIAEIVSEDEQNKIGSEEKEILINAVNFTDTIVEDVMVPRADIISVKYTDSFAKIKEVILETKHTRIPVIDASRDDVKGFIHMKDVLEYFDGSKKFQVEDIIRRSLFVPPSMKIVDLLYKMRNSDTRIAMVIDEYGGTDGLVTMEDLMEEIVGEIDEEEVVSLGNNNYEVNARIKIDALEEKLNIKLVKHSKFEDDFDTLGGLIGSISQKIPKTGEIVKHPSGIKFHIKEAASRYIKTVIIEL